MNSAFLAVDPMTASRTAIVLLTGFLLGCGPSRITKLPVPRESVLVSYRLMGEADQMLEEGKDHLAILKYLEATNLNPYHEAIFNKLAIAYCRTGRFWQGRKAAEHAIRLDPRYAPAHNTLGIALLSNRQYEKAVRSFEQAIAIDPQSFFYVNLGYGQMLWGHYDLARRAYRNAMDLDPQAFDQRSGTRVTYSDPMGLDPETHYNLARLFAEMENLAQCLNYLAKALAVGFLDQERLAAEQAFDRFRDRQEFIELLNLYGLGTR